MNFVIGEVTTENDNLTTPDNDLSPAILTEVKNLPKRLQLDLSPEAWDLLNQLREKSDAKSNADLVRKSLAVYVWLVTEFNLQDTLLIQNEKRETLSMLSIKALKAFSL